MLRLLALLLMLASVLLAEDEQPLPVPSMRPSTWDWAAVYADGSGKAVVLAMTATTGVRLDLGTGSRPAPKPVTLSKDGLLNDGAALQDRGRRLANPDLPLVARWVTATRSDGFDHISITVPIPVEPDSPLRSIFLGHQNALLAKAIENFNETRDSTRSTPGEEPLPTGTSKWSDQVLTEVTWWSANLVSTLEWEVDYYGGVHSNTHLAGRTLLRGQDGTWRICALTDLLGEDAAWKPKAIAFIVADLKRQQAGWFVDSDPRLRPKNEELFKVWSVADDGLLLSFPPYIAGPYSQGVFQVRIPWAELGTFRPR